jgi:hypothetical protein
MISRIPPPPCGGMFMFCLDFLRRFFDKKAHEPVSCADPELGSTWEFGST